MNRAMEQVDQVTQRNASAAEELSSTAEELAAQAESLQQMMTFFRTSEDSRGEFYAPVPRQPSPPATGGRGARLAMGLKTVARDVPEYSAPSTFPEEPQRSAPGVDRDFKRF